MFFNSSRKYVIKTTMKTLGLSKNEATKRIDALLKSGILEDGSPGDTMTQMLIENFLRFDLNNLEYKAVFSATMHFPALVAEYDKREGKHLGKVLEQLKKDDYNFEDVKEQIQSFDKFFCHKIWNRFPGVPKYDLKPQ